MQKLTRLIAVASFLAPLTARAEEDKSLKKRFDEERESRSWGIYPGIYRSYDFDTRGFELSVLYDGFGGCFGIEKGKTKYLEAEIGWWLIALGAGVRRSDTDDRKMDFQATWAFPVLPIFPYGRWIAADDDKAKSSEYGLMLKVPLLF